MKRGYVSEYRSIIEAELWSMPPLYYKVWRWLNLNVNWETKLVKSPHHPTIGIHVSKDMIITSLSRIAEGVSYTENRAKQVPSRKTILTILQFLTSNTSKLEPGNTLINLTSNSYGTTIMINKIDTYGNKNNELETVKNGNLEHFRKQTGNIYNKKESLKKESFNKKKEESLSLKKGEFSYNEYREK